MNDPFLQDLPNHLVGLKQTYVKLTFLTTHDLTKVRKDLLSAVRRNKERQKTSTAYADMLAESMQVIKRLSCRNIKLYYSSLNSYTYSLGAYFQRYSCIRIWKIYVVNLC